MVDMDADVLWEGEAMASASASTRLWLQLAVADVEEEVGCSVGTSAWTREVGKLGGFFAVRLFS